MSAETVSDFIFASVYLCSAVSALQINEIDFFNASVIGYTERAAKPDFFSLSASGFEFFTAVLTFTFVKPFVPPMNF